jgi:hypothetical protein
MGVCGIHLWLNAIACWCVLSCSADSSERD